MGELFQLDPKFYFSVYEGTYIRVPSVETISLSNVMFSRNHENLPKDFLNSFKTRCGQRNIEK